MAWDCGPKIFPLPRGDAVLAFAGYTTLAYPLIIQALRWAEDYSRSSDRSQSLEDLKGHLERQATHLLAQVDRSGISGDPGNLMDATLMLAGYSWQTRRFRIWASAYDEKSKAFTFQNAPSKMGVVFVGDETQSAHKALVDVMRPKLRSMPKGKRPKIELDWEPFDVLRDAIRSPDFKTIGGPPQIAKVYQHLNVMPIGVRWPDAKSGRVTLLGRELLDYERTRRRVMCPDTHEIKMTWKYLD